MCGRTYRRVRYNDGSECSCHAHEVCLFRPAVQCKTHGQGMGIKATFYTFFTIDLLHPLQHILVTKIIDAVALCHDKSPWSHQGTIAPSRSSSSATPHNTIHAYSTYAIVKHCCYHKSSARTVSCI